MLDEVFHAGLKAVEGYAPVVHDYCAVVAPEFETLVVGSLEGGAMKVPVRRLRRVMAAVAKSSTLCRGRGWRRCP